MADNKTTFLKRVASGVLAAAFLIASFVVYGSTGLMLISSIMIVLGIREYARMAFVHWQMPQAVSVAYLIVCLAGFVAMFRWPDHDALFLAITGIAFVVSALWLTRERVSNENLLAALALGAFGLFYCMLFPLYALRLISLKESGAEWFLFLLLVVFAGDTFAYFSGRWFGQRKFMPSISPNKTWAGSIGGLIGSMVLGVGVAICCLPGISLWQTALFSLVCGFTAQSGDLLMSLVKRVAHVKDSGTIMPGHGGILDRLDGVFISCPLVYAFALYVMN